MTWNGLITCKASANGQNQRLGVNQNAKYSPEVVEMDKRSSGSDCESLNIIRRCSAYLAVAFSLKLTTREEVSSYTCHTKISDPWRLGDTSFVTTRRTQLHLSSIPIHFVSARTSASIVWRYSVQRGWPVRHVPDSEPSSFLAVCGALCLFTIDEDHHCNKPGTSSRNATHLA